MNRLEALHTLGLDEDATLQDIKVAYKESVQIFHPDKFAKNKKLQDRATEQFKHLQEAYDFLTSGRGSRGSSAPRSASSRSYESSAMYIEAQLAGLAAARTQLVAQRDELEDERHRDLIMVFGGMVVAVLFRRIIPLAGVAGMMIVVGVVDLMTTFSKISTINDNLHELDFRKKELEARLEEEE